MYRYFILISLIYSIGGCESARVRIVHGRKLTIEDVPYQISLYNIPKQRLRCGGSIVSSQYILTAGHCATDPPQNYKVRAGSTYYNKDGNVHKVVEVIQHENFGYNKYGRPINDIALMKVEPAFEIDNKTQKVVGLFDKNETVERKTDAVVTGYGLTEDNNVSEQLKGLTVITMEHEICNHNYKDLGGLAEHQICAVHPEQDRDFCNGDSGGPLVINGRQIGVVSWSGPGCAQMYRPGVYTEIAAYRDWIDEHISNHNGTQNF